MKYLFTFTVINFFIINLVHSKANNNNHEQDIKKTPNSIEFDCFYCKLATHSIDIILKRPRQVDEYGNVGERASLDKIKQGICSDVESDSHRSGCREFFFKHLDSIKNWRDNKLHKASIFDSLCIQETKLCCPANSYGPRCHKCPKCESNQECHLEGTRGGNGTCICIEGHTGSDCSSCLPGYYKEMILQDISNNKDAHRNRCLPCHRSCSQCTSGHASGCKVCRKGFEWVPRWGCLDIDECNISAKAKVCQGNKFCVNTEGSYYCYECDRACKGCFGDGPESCNECADGYLKDTLGNCVAKHKTILPPEANYYRYAIYVGMCISTFIIFQNNVFISALVGLAVGLYISYSEYIMSTAPTGKDYNG